MADVRRDRLGLIAPATGCGLGERELETAGPLTPLLVTGALAGKLGLTVVPV